MAPHIFLTGKGLLKPNKSLNTIKIILWKSDFQNGKWHVFVEWPMCRQEVGKLQAINLLLSSFVPI